MRHLFGSSNDREVETLLRQRGTVINPEIPINWKDGAKSLDTPRFNPHGRSVDTIKAIFRRKRRGFPHPAYGVMGTVLELQKPLGQLLED